MKSAILFCLIMLISLGFTACSDSEAIPCQNATVLDNSNVCGGGDLIVLTGNDEYPGPPRCGNGVEYKMVRVVNLPEDLKYEGATFTCQVEEIKDDQICAAIYVHYPSVKITNICSQDTAPVVAAGK